MSLRLLVVDDEPLIRAGIRHGLTALEEIEIIGECDSGARAVDAILRENPDLVLLDVQMPDGTGLDVVRQVGPDRMPPVVFVTAYDEYAVKAFECNAVDYLLKPFDDDRLRSAIERAQGRIAGQRDAAMARKFESLLERQKKQWPERLVVRDGDRFRFVPVETVDWIESANNYVLLHCGAQQHLMAETLTHLEEQLNPAKFLRIHRCRIVNVSRVHAVRPYLSGTYQLELAGGTRLGSGRQYGEVVRGLFKN
jgi:two-component system, LytTR family, response regulator